MNTKLILLFSLCWLYTFDLVAQDPFFSQYNQGESILNPALIGDMVDEKKNRLSANYRNYWENAYQTSLLEYERKLSLNTNQIGIGLAFLQEKVGIGSSIAHNSLIFSIAYHKKINTNQTLQVGVGTTIERILVNTPTLEWPNSHKENEGFSYTPLNEEILGQSSLSAGINTGLVWKVTNLSGNQFKLGASIYHLNHLNYSNSFVPSGHLYRASKWSVHTSYLMKLGSKLDMIPSFLVLYQAYPGTEMLVGGSDFSVKIGITDALMFGTYTRLSRHHPQDALFLGSFIGMLGYQHQELNFRFSCDFYRKAIYGLNLKNAFEFSTDWVF